jgi:hypothetical protein
MKQDKLLTAAIIGGLSTIAGEIITKILVLCKVGTYAVFALNSLLITNNQPSMLLGFILNFIIGSYVAIGAYLFFTRFGSEHLVIKCTLGSLMIWFIFELTFTALIEDKYMPIRPVIDHIQHILGTASFGITLGLLLRACVFKERA